MADLIHPVKGTRDFYPDQMAIRTWLYDNVRQVSESFGYQEYEGPFLESIDLYAAKSGEELVNEQSFVFPDRGGNLITLRPELTPTLVRMVAQQQRQLVYPLRWWSFGPFWRYERPQKGRSREFFQWNIDLIGVNSPEADAEIVAVLANFFKVVGLKSNEVAIMVNNRRLLERELERIGIPAEEFIPTFKLIDRRGKLNAQKWEAYAQDIGLNTKQFEGINILLENQDLWKDSDELVRFFIAIKTLGVSKYVRFAPHIVRGLDYYTGIVYEGHALTNSIRRAIAGGGRYDNLMADVGGDPLPGTGFAMGDLVITLALEEFGHLPKETGLSPAPVLVTVFDKEHLLASFTLASELRQEGIKVTCYPTTAKLSGQFKYADRIGARVAIVLGPDEQALGQVTIKDLENREQKTIPRKQVKETISQILAEDLS